MFKKARNLILVASLVMLTMLATGCEPPSYRLRVVPKPSWAAEIVGLESSYKENEVAQFEFAPQKGYRFYRWIGPVQPTEGKNGKWQITMTRNTVLEADFVHIDALLLEAIENDNLSEVKSLLAEGADVDNVDQYNMVTPLMLAAEVTKGAEICQALLQAGANAKARDRDGRTALMYATRTNESPETIKTLIRAGVNVDARDKSGKTALMYAAESNTSLEVVQALLATGANSEARCEINSWTPLMYAIRGNGNYEIIRTLLAKAKADVNAKGEPHGRTLLMQAARWNGNSQVIKALVDAGAQLNVRDDRGWTALMHAAYGNRNPEVVEMLLELGADGSLRSREGLTAFDYAKENRALRNSQVYWQLNDARFEAN